LRDSLKIRVPGFDAPEPAAAPAEPAAAAAPDAPGVVDPMQWWGALTQQFTELATTALKDTDAARAMAGDMVKQSFDTASAGLKKAAASAPQPAAKKAAAKTAARKKAAPRTR
ncbi:MAG: hypothetical protein ABUL50_13005, partial [Rhizobacter sp.]